MNIRTIKVRSRREQLANVAENFRQAYQYSSGTGWRTFSNNGWLSSGVVIYNQLLTLGPQPESQQVEAILGANHSLILTQCTTCGRDVEVVVKINNSNWYCHECLIEMITALSEREQLEYAT